MSYMKRKNGCTCHNATELNCYQNLTCLRVFREVKRIAAGFGIKGDPLAEFTNRVGTLGEELLIVDIILEVPKRTKRQEPALVRQIARTIVLSCEGARNV